MKVDMGICKDLGDFRWIGCLVEETLALNVRPMISRVTRRSSHICLNWFLLRNQVDERFRIQRDSFMPFLGLLSIVITLTLGNLIYFQRLGGHDSWIDKVRKCKEIRRTQINNTFIFFLKKRRSSWIHIGLVHLWLWESFIHLLFKINKFLLHLRIDVSILGSLRACIASYIAIGQYNAIMRLIIDDDVRRRLLG